MTDEARLSAIEELESRAKQLHSGIESGDPGCLGRVRARIAALTEAEYGDVTLEHARMTVAREAGFKTWRMAGDLFAGRLGPGDDFGDFWYSTSTDVLLNHWCRNYEEAREVHQHQGGYLLPYRRHFAVVQKAYIEILGMEGDDPAWQSVRFNLVEPADRVSYHHLTLRRLRQIRPNLKKKTYRWIC